MDLNEKTLAVFQTRVHDLILRFRQLSKENEELYAMVDQNERQIKQLQDQIREQGKDYEALKAARMLAVTDQDIEATKKRLSKLIRDVNKCIAILTDQQ